MDPDLDPDPQHCFAQVQIKMSKLSELSAWVSGGGQGSWVMLRNPCCGPHSTTVALPHLHTIGLNNLDFWVRCPVPFCDPHSTTVALPHLYSIGLNTLDCWVKRPVTCYGLHSPIVAPPHLHTIGLNNLDC